jgi:NAD(P)-dependent dehydrogenase (short-subunit alcohol dehydrogenase family)
VAEQIVQVARDAFALGDLRKDAVERAATGLSGDRIFAGVVDVRDEKSVQAFFTAAERTLGPVTIAVANAGIAAQLPIVGGDPKIFEAINSVNVLGAYYTLRAAGPHVSHPDGYAVAVASLTPAGFWPAHAPRPHTYTPSPCLRSSTNLPLR